MNSDGDVSSVMNDDGDVSSLSMAIIHVTKGRGVTFQYMLYFNICYMRPLEHPSRKGRGVTFQYMLYVNICYMRPLEHPSAVVARMRAMVCGRARDEEPRVTRAQLSVPPPDSGSTSCGEERRRHATSTIRPAVPKDEGLSMAIIHATKGRGVTF